MKRNKLIYKIVLWSFLICLIFTGCSSGALQQTTTPAAKESSTPASSPAKTADGANTTEPQKQDEVSVNVPDWSYDATIYEVNVRQYTKEGTFKAFEEHLPRLQKMGVKVLWFMPIYPISKERRNGSLGSYYAVADYTGVNPEFGTIDDFKALVKKCHDMGFKVMLDWVANHTGWDNKWISEHKDWYTQDTKGNIIIPPTTNWQDVADLNYKNEDMRKAMIESMAYWVKECDIDGFRCDYAGGVPADFWEAARETLDAIKPVYMLAEDDRSMALLKKAFNSDYGWSLYKTLNSIAKGNGTASSLVSYFTSLEARFPKGTYPLHFIDNHDENSWNGTVEERMGQAQNALLSLIFTAPGMPLIYSGQEANLNKRLQFFEKDQIDWTSLSNEELITKLVNLKKEHKSLWNGEQGGSISFFEASDKQILAYERVKDNDRILVILNLSKEKKDFTIKVDNAFDGKSALSGSQISLKQGENQLQMDPWGFEIIVP